MASLATAMTSSKMKFSNELTYIPGMAGRSCNQATLEEGGMQVSKSFNANNFILLALW